jgi:hypothetical protein
MLPAAQAGACQARDETRDRGRSQRHLAGTRFLRTVEYCVHRAGESDGASWNSRPGTSHLGHFSTVSTAAGPSGVVASLLSFCPSSRIVAGSSRAASRTRWQTSSATLSATNSSNGRRENQPTMDGARGALVPLVACFRLRAREIKCRCGVVSLRDR